MMDLQVITSRQNSIVRHAAEIASSAQKRHEENLFLAEGARLCEDAARSNLEIKAAFFTEQALAKYKGYIDVIKPVAEESYVVKDHVAALLSQTKHTQGVFVLCEIPVLDKTVLEGKSVALENLQDPANLGAVMRTAEAVGIDNVVLTGDGCDPYSPKALRASMGAVFRMNVALFKETCELLELCRSTNTKSFAAVINNDALKLGEISFPDNAMVFVGNEGNGLEEKTISACDERVTIPMAGRAESLNAAAAAAILIWELRK